MQALFADHGIPAFRAKQVAEWIYKRGVGDFSLMDNLPHSLRMLLAAQFSLPTVRLLRQLISVDRKTTKFLLEYPDGTAIEAVLMRQSYGNSICISTQAGCGMGCVFCASAINGVVRNLTAGEILAQALYINQLLRKESQQVNTIVIMGSGEPLANYENVLAFIRLCHESYIMNLGYRNITISTSGIVPMIVRLAEENLPITLSISLHASNDTMRSELMPVNEKYGIRTLVQAGAAYARQTGRRITYEYILIDGKNDSTACAEELSRLIRGQLANVNLIPINPVPEGGLYRPSPAKISAFAAALERNHIAVTVRKEMGADIQAACGQLRNRHLVDGDSGE